MLIVYIVLHIIIDMHTISVERINEQSVYLGLSNYQEVMNGLCFMQQNFN